MRLAAELKLVLLCRICRFVLVLGRSVRLKSLPKQYVVAKQQVDANMFH